MKKILFALAIIASGSLVSCSADSISDEVSTANPAATGGDGTVIPIKPPPPPVTGP